MKIAIVDAYSTGRFLAPALRRYGIDAVHVQSDPALPRFYLDGYQPDDFLDGLVYQGDTAGTVRWLRDHDVGLITAGSEPGVDLAERLGTQLGTPVNGADTPGARRDKALMTELVRAAGLATARTEVFTTVESLVAYARQWDRWPLVLKPRDSAGSDNVLFCADVNEVRAAGRKILAGSNLMGATNRSVVAQEFLAGDEYFVNTVSQDGRHHVAEVWRYHKLRLPGGGYLYDYEEPVAWESGRRIREYVLGVLTALQLRHGPAHTEVMVTDDRGPVLLETGARLAGTILPEVVSRCFGTNQVELTASVYGDPAGFAASAGRPYQIHGHLRYVSLICPHPAVMAGEDPFAALRDLPTYAGMLVTVPDGGVLGRTVDSATSPGVVYLHGPDAAEVTRDYLVLRGLERRCLYPEA